VTRLGGCVPRHGLPARRHAGARATIGIVVLLASPQAWLPARAESSASLRCIGSGQPARPDGPAPTFEWTGRLTHDRGTLAFRRRGPEWRGFLQVTPGSRWLLIAGDVAVGWAAGGMTAPDESFDRFVRMGIAPVSRGVLRAHGTISWGRDRTRGIALAGSLGGLGLGGWVVGEAHGGGVFAGPIALACERPEGDAAPVEFSLAARVPGACLVEVVGRGGRRPALVALAGRWKASDPAGLGSIDGAFRLHSPSEAPESGADDGWDLRWSRSSGAGYRPSIQARTVRSETGGPLPELTRRLGIAITGMDGVASFGASMSGEECERCGKHPDDPNRRVLVRSRRLVADIHARLGLTPGLTLGLRYRQDGLEDEIDPADMPVGPTGGDGELIADTWDRGQGDAMLGELTWRSTRGLWAGLSLAAASDGEGPSTWVPARRPFGGSQGVLLPAGDWLGQMWIGARWRRLRLEGVCRLRSDRTSGTTASVTLLGGLELQVG